MPPDPEVLPKAAPIRCEAEHGPRDTILYALGIGAGELRHIYEDGLVALPTMATILAAPDRSGAGAAATLGALAIELHRPLPVAGRIASETVIEDAFDRGAGKERLLVSRRTLFEAGAEAPLATLRMTHVRNGGGGAGPRREPPKPYATPKRAGDLSVSLATWPHQSALFRLSGERDAIHIDPQAAYAAGLDQPTLPPLCLYGIAGRALIRALCGNDAARLRRLDARFRSPLYAGETIRTEIWELGQGQAAFRAFAAERGQLVLSNGFVAFA